MDITSLANAYVAFKESISTQTGMGDGLLHVHAGLLILLGSAVALRRPLRSLVPIALVIGFAAANEAFDSGSTWERSLSGSAGDFINTVFWPAILWLCARYMVPPLSPDSALAQTAAPTDQSGSPN